MNEEERKEESRTLKYKRKRRKAKRMREKRKKVKAKQARDADRQRRILNEAERMLEERIARGELLRNPGGKSQDEEKQEQAGSRKRAGSALQEVDQAERVLEERIARGELLRNPGGKSQDEEKQEQAGSRKRASSALQEVDVPSAKVARTSVVREIASHHVTISKQHLGSGSYGACYLGTYRNMTVVVKNLHVKELQGENRKQAENRVRDELIYEARIINKLGDHPGLAFLFGVCSRSAPFRLIIQFHGNQKDNSSLTISTALRKRIVTDRAIWIGILGKVALALSRVHKVGFLHNDLKANNVVLDKSERKTYNPVIIDFGKSLPMTGLQGPKNLTKERQVKYMEAFPHIAPEIVTGLRGQSVKSDTFSFGKLAERLHCL